ncbi:MAG TPA: hypothetical protein PLG90_02300 [Ignavibacteria bacterium]|nr:hypothetical protein [Ignavibacteria bacterium]
MNIILLQMLTESMVGPLIVIIFLIVVFIGILVVRHVAKQKYNIQEFYNKQKDNNTN